MRNIPQLPRQSGRVDEPLQPMARGKSRDKNPAAELRASSPTEGTLAGCRSPLQISASWSGRCTRRDGSHPRICDSPHQPLPSPPRQVRIMVCAPDTISIFPGLEGTLSAMLLEALQRPDVSRTITNRRRQLALVDPPTDGLLVAAKRSRHLLSRELTFDMLSQGFGDLIITLPAVFAHRRLLPCFLTITGPP